ncbi:MAG: DUF5615 family PIN-like protein [Chloroflexota bacterium]|nr:DUF5615 family PIN-like protein [Chloroflexota bacterium]
MPYLRQRGFVVRTAQSQGMTAASDEQQIRRAHADRSLLLTTNVRRDYVRLHAIFDANDEMHSGIITIPETFNPDRLTIRAAMMLDWITIEFTDPHNRLFRWTDLQRRLIDGYLRDGYTTVEITLVLGRTNEIR